MILENCFKLAFMRSKITSTKWTETTVTI